MFEFLQQLVFYKDAELLLFSKYKTKIFANEKNDFLKLDAELRGERIDASKHELLVDVKAVTWHKFSVEKISGAGGKAGWKAQVILDV